MLASELVEDDFVRFDHPQGSTGKIVYNEGQRIVVEWVYGRDAYDQVVRASTTYYAEKLLPLRKISEQEYLAVRDCRFNANASSP